MNLSRTNDKNIISFPHFSILEKNQESTHISLPPSFFWGGVRGWENLFSKGKKDGFGFSKIFFFFFKQVNPVNPIAFWGKLKIWILLQALVSTRSEKSITGDIYSSSSIMRVHHCYTPSPEQKNSFLDKIIPRFFILIQKLKVSFAMMMYKKNHWKGDFFKKRRRMVLR